MIASQVVRLHQHDAGSWIAWDYAGRLGALAILAAIPAARAVAFRWDKRQISLLEIALWIVGLSLVERVSQWPLRMINAAFPATVLGVYPQPTGWLYLIDLVFGLALVAASEEIIFRQCIRHALLPFLGRGSNCYSGDVTRFRFLSSGGPGLEIFLWPPCSASCLRSCSDGRSHYGRWLSPTIWWI